MINASMLSRSFNGVPAVESLSFEIPEGSLFTLLGPNGAGKTTTVRLLLGLIAPNSGTARVAGYQLGQSNNALRAVCGLLTETPGFYDRMSAWENLTFFAQLYRIPETIREQRLREQLRAMNLWERRNDLVGTFSKGMKQKLAIIRAVFHEPKVIFLDEPTAGLDPEASLMVREMISKLKGEGRTIVVCTHNLDEAQRLADIVGIINRRLLVCDTLTNLRSGAGLTTPIEIELRAPLVDHQLAAMKLPFVKSIDGKDGKYVFEVENPAINTPQLVRALVDTDAQVYAVRPQTRDLETIYLECVNEGGVSK
ncbi:MAG TPA: ABC transporter ATP-binding protein [Pyrinomonadaceae bacterium]|nr:ABC transporter ATP-binding protein [Pyrinomonadaceae bacterium]